MGHEDKFGYDPDEIYWDLTLGKSITGREANTLLESASNSDVEALVLLTIVPMQLHTTEGSENKCPKQVT